MTKILFIIDRLSAGAGRVLYDIVKNIKSESVIVSVYSDGDMIEAFKELKIKIIFADKKPGIGLGFIFKLKKIIKKEKPDIVHTHNVDAYEYGILAAWLAGVDKIIHTSHGKSVKEDSFRKLRERLYHKTISLFLNKYIAVSKDLAKYASKNWCIGKRIRVICNGIDTDKYKPVKTDKKFLYESGVDKDDYLIGIIAGLRPVKNHACLIKAMKIVVQVIPNTKLLIIGDGPEKDKIILQVYKSGLKNDVIFLGQRKDTIEIYNSLDVNVLCSFSECFSMTLLEAMSCQVPCIATDVGGNKELIDDGEDGFLIDIDHKILAEKIIDLLRDDALRKNIGIKAREKIINEFDVKKMVKEYDEIYLN